MCPKRIVKKEPAGGKIHQKGKSEKRKKNREEQGTGGKSKCPGTEIAKSR